MGDAGSPENQATEAQTASRLCVVCKSPINPGAMKCLACGSYQNPFRSFLSGVDIQALITLIPVAALAFAFVKDQLVTAQADLRVQPMECNGDQLTVAAANVGNRDALFAGAILLRGDRQITLQLEVESNDDLLLGPGAVRIYGLTAADAMGALLNLGLNSAQPCEYHIKPKATAFEHSVAGQAIVCACPES